MAQLRIACFGSFQVTLADQTVAFRSNKGRALLLYLAVEQERAHSRSTLAGLLWPELPEARARQNLSQTLLEVRRAIGDQQAAPPFLQISAQQIAFAPTSDHWLDVTQFGLAIANHDYAQSA
ncbi:MAG TPA: hypothetical protein P5121_31700, partial [Caldilineaceae bacterium]|nr:hypothetical protein [Caldilineaceae bacterium]